MGTVPAKEKKNRPNEKKQSAVSNCRKVQTAYKGGVEGTGWLWNPRRLDGEGVMGGVTKDGFTRDEKGDVGAPRDRTDEGMDGKGIFECKKGRWRPQS